MSRKNIFIAWLVAFLIIIWIIFYTIWNSAKKSSTTTKKWDLSIRVVWDETAWFSDIITSFKSKYPEYAWSEIKFTKFSNYADYEKTLLNIMIDGNSPDIFVINNSSVNAEWNWLLESKIIWLSNDVINQDYFEKNFNSVLYDELVVQTEQENENWEQVLVWYLKWVPMWFQTFWVFYNLKKVKNVPDYWDDIDKEALDKKQDDYSTIWIGFWWKYIINPTDILTLLFLQNNVSDYSKLDDSKARNALDKYLSFWINIDNWLDLLKPEMDSLKITTTDLFVRWKIWMIIWYPSLMDDILDAIKRTSWESNISERYLLTAPIFQIDASSDKTNLIDYNFFALSKFTKNEELWYKFLWFLTEKESQQSYINNAPYYLPALKSLEEERLKEPLKKGFNRTNYKDFYQSDVNLVSFNKWLKNEYDSYFNSLLDYTDIKSNESLNKAKVYLDCSFNHIIMWVDFEKDCN